MLKQSRSYFFKLQVGCVHSILSSSLPTTECSHTTLPWLYTYLGCKVVPGWSLIMSEDCNTHKHSLHGAWRNISATVLTFDWFLLCSNCNFNTCTILWLWCMQWIISKVLLYNNYEDSLTTALKECSNM